MKEMEIEIHIKCHYSFEILDIRLPKTCAFAKMIQNLCGNLSIPISMDESEKNFDQG